MYLVNISLHYIGTQFIKHSKTHLSWGNISTWKNTRQGAFHINHGQTF